MNVNYAQFTVVSISDNANNFGLRGVIIMDREGHTFEIGVNSLYLPEKGKVLVGETNLKGNELTKINGISYEIPRYKGVAPADVIREVWKTEKYYVTHTHNHVEHIDIAVELGSGLLEIVEGNRKGITIPESKVTAIHRV